MQRVWKAQPLILATNTYAWYAARWMCAFYFVARYVCILFCGKLKRHVEKKSRRYFFPVFHCTHTHTVALLFFSLFFFSEHLFCVCCTKHRDFDKWIPFMAFSVRKITCSSVMCFSKWVFVEMIFFTPNNYIFFGKCQWSFSGVFPC